LEDILYVGRYIILKVMHKFIRLVVNKKILFFNNVRFIIIFMVQPMVRIGFTL